MDHMEPSVEVKMLEDVRVSPDGIHVETVSAGQILSLPQSLAKSMVRDKQATFELKSKESDQNQNTNEKQIKSPDPNKK